MFKKSMLAISLLAAAQLSVAAPITFDLYNPFGDSLGFDLTALDWAESGSGLNVSPDPAMNVGDVFEFRLQTKLASVTPLDNLDNPNGYGLFQSFANGGFEFTAVATIQFVVTENVGGVDLNFETINDSGHVSIFYDDAVAGGVKAVTETGVGFNDGIQVAKLAVEGPQPIDGTGFATYSASNPNPGSAGVGSAKTKFSVLYPDDFINHLVFRTIDSSINTLVFESNQNRPAGTSTATTVNGHLVTPADVLMKVDGSSQFYDVSIPEPGTSLLFGAGLVGLGFMRRKFA